MRLAWGISHTAASCCCLAVWILTINPTIKPNTYKYKNPPPKLLGTLQPNNKLQGVSKLHDRILIGPESFTVSKAGVLYTGTAEGAIWEINLKNDEAKKITHMCENCTDCGSYEKEIECGRVQGIKVSPTHDDHLYFVDTYTGLQRLNLRTNNREHIASESKGIPFKFVNSLDIDTNGKVYFTDTSSKWHRRDYPYEVLEMNKFGRLLEYNPHTDTTRTLLPSLRMPNGVALSHDHKSLLISEMNACRIIRYHLTGSKEGQKEIVVDNLPGYPDNIKPTTTGTYYVGLASSRFDGSSPMGSLLDITAPYPWIKTIIAKVTPYSLYKKFLPKHSILLEISEAGEIVNSFHDPTGGVVMNGLSEAFEYEGYVYIGHFSAQYLGKIEKAKLYV